MNTDDSTTILVDSVTRALGDVLSLGATIQAQADGIDRVAWRQLSALGLVGEASEQLTLREMSAIVQAIGQCGALVPYADSEAMARWLARAAGIASEPSEILALSCVSPDLIEAPPQGPATAVKLAGLQIPWGRLAERLLVAFDRNGGHFVGVVATRTLALSHQSNLAGEPADRCDALSAPFEQVIEVGVPHGPRAVLRRGALLRSAAMLGAASRLLDMTIQYAGDRQQFGRSLSQFQVVQSHIAAMAGEFAAAGAMFETALAAQEMGPPERLTPRPEDGSEIAALKVRIGQAAQVMTSLAHQVHGAIGFTQEYPLHLWSRRLWAWREEYGNEAQWAAEVGATMLAIGADDFWTRMTR